MHEKYSVRFDAKAMIDGLGGPKRVHKLLTAAGCDIQYKTVIKWAERGHLPPGAIAVIVAVKASKGEIFRLADYIVDNGEEPPRDEKG